MAVVPLFARWGNGRDVTAYRVSSFVQDALRGGLRAWPQLEWLGVPNRLLNPERYTVRKERVHSTIVTQLASWPPPGESGPDVGPGESAR